MTGKATERREVSTAASMEEESMGCTTMVAARRVGPGEESAAEAEAAAAIAAH